MLDLGSNPTSDILSEAEIKGSAKIIKRTAVNITPSAIVGRPNVEFFVG